MKSKFLLTLSAAFLAFVTVTFASASDNEEVPHLTPKGTLSLEYPNQWDINLKIALTNDGSRLIDASENARYIRVWDWQNKNVVKRLLLNEKAPERNDGRQHMDMVLKYLPGQELALSPDGRMVAACVSINRTTVARVWDLESGAIVTDISSYQHDVPGTEQQISFEFACHSLSFSPDGKHLALLADGVQYANEADRKYFTDIVDGGINPQTHRYKNGLSWEELRAQKYYPASMSGIALFETKNWKLEHLFYRTGHKQEVNSRPLFDSDSKTVSAVIIDRAPFDPQAKKASLVSGWAGNRIVRWDVATGAQLEEREVPQLTDSPDMGVWWTLLPGGREVWWRTTLRADQTDQERNQCRQNPPSAPAFVSDEKSNCAFGYSLAILDMGTGKIRYLTPFKKNVPPHIGDKGEHQWASISPDGAYIVLVRTTPEPERSTIEILDRRTLRTVGAYSADIEAFLDLVFSDNSTYFSFRYYKSSYSAMIFELPKTK